jgi:purine-binding chemotaxis protein CheW
MQNYVHKIFKFLIFETFDELLAVDVTTVLEVLKNPALSPIPKQFDFIEGLLNFRGNIITVIDLQKKLYNTNNIEYKDFTVIIVKSEIGVEKLILGFKVKNIKDVVNISEDKVKSVPEFGSNYNPDNYEGSFKYKNNHILILKSEKAF